MAEDTGVVTQIVHLLRKQPPGVWELVEPTGSARSGDIVLRDADGTPAAYARPADQCSPEPSSARRGGALRL